MTPRRKVVFVGDNSPAVQTTLKDLLERAGVHAYLARSASNPNAATEFIGGFKCALVTLERVDGYNDPIDEAELLRMYQPELAIAFLHSDASRHMLERAATMGPIFRKDDELDAAVAWALDRALT
jgi:two-component SAPR family response regulator